MIKKIFEKLIIITIFVVMVSCGKKDDTIKIVFLPNESNESLKTPRDEFAKIIQNATGKKVEIITTTDYNIALENIISGKAQIAYLGAEGILGANEKNKDVQAVLTNAGASGTLADSLYYSFIAVRESDAAQYKSGNGYDLKKLKGKSISFVTNNSTSGFKVPGRVLAGEFGLKSEEELLENGKVFSKVIFGNSHPGTQANLFRKDADAATFAIPKSFTIYELVSGEENKSGATYKVKEGVTTEPFKNYIGSSFTVIKSIPVLNGAITFNVKSLSEEDQKKIKAALLSKETTNNIAIFAPKTSKTRSLFLKENENVGFVETDTKWYEQVKEIK